MSYGLAPSLTPTADDQKQLAALLAERLPPHHYDFLMTLPLSFDCGDYFFVHAGVRPGVALSDQRAASHQRGVSSPRSETAYRAGFANHSCTQTRNATRCPCGVCDGICGRKASY